MISIISFFGGKTLVRLLATWQRLNLIQTLFLIFLNLFSPLSRLLFNGRLKPREWHFSFFLSEHNSTFVCVLILSIRYDNVNLCVYECFLISLMSLHSVLYWFGLSVGPVCSGQVSVWLSNSPGNYSILVLLQVYVILMFSLSQGFVLCLLTVVHGLGGIPML